MSTLFEALQPWHFIIVSILALCIVRPAIADPSPAVQVKDIIDKTLTEPYQAHGFQGIFVQSMDTGKVIYDHNGDKLMVPASCMKIIASSVALDLLGPDYKVTTSVYATAKPVKGVLNGDLVIVGQGDSRLKLEELQGLADQVRQMGIKKVKGRIIGDASWFDGSDMAGLDPEDEPYYYAAPASALSVNENYVSVHLLPGAKVGDPAVVRLDPDTHFFTVKNECVTGEAKSRMTGDATRARGSRVIEVTGSVPLGYKEGQLIPETGLTCERLALMPSDSKEPQPVEMLSVGDSALFVGTIFKEMLERDGVKVTGAVERGIKPESAVLIASHDSPTLARMITIQNKPSDNFMTECLLHTLGKVMKGKGTARTGIEVEKDWLKKIGIDPSVVMIEDGSGLSRRNLVSAESFARILAYIYHTKSYDALGNSFPIAGVDSHLKNRMLNTPAVNNVKAKTGYIRYVCSLSGYVKTLAGENLAVSIIQNNHLCSLDEAYVMQDEIFEALSKITTRTDSD